MLPDTPVSRLSTFHLLGSHCFAQLVCANAGTSDKNRMLKTMWRYLRGNIKHFACSKESLAVHVALPPSRFKNGKWATNLQFQRSLKSACHISGDAPIVAAAAAEAAPVAAAAAAEAATAPALAAEEEEDCRSCREADREA